MRRIAILAVCFGLFAAPALAQSKAAIQKLEDQWGAAFNKGDAAAVAAMYAEDAYVLASLCVDLKISEIVDAGQYVVSALLPLNVFASQ